MSEKVGSRRDNAIPPPPHTCCGRDKPVWLLWLAEHFVSASLTLLFFPPRCSQSACRGRHPPLNTCIMWQVDCTQSPRSEWCNAALCDAHFKIMACMNMSMNGVYLRQYIWWMMRRVYPRLCYFALMNKLRRTQRVILNSPQLSAIRSMMHRLLLCLVSSLPPWAD